LINEKEKDEDKKLKLEEDVLDFLEHLKSLEKEYKNILKKYSVDFGNSNKKEQDILHYIEFKDLSAVGAYRLVRELSKVRKERRTAEDTVQFLNRIGSNFTFNNDKTIDGILNSKNKKMEIRTYHTKYYTENTLNNIVNKKIKE
jgi:hypothetical protein